MFKDTQIPKNIGSKHSYYLDEATKTAHKSSMTHQHGCVIVSDTGDIIACGFNKNVNFMCHQFSIHAEADAISKLKKIMLLNVSMYIVRISPAGIFLKYSKPCNNCQKLIQKCGIKRVYYSTSYEFNEQNNIK